MDDSQQPVSATLLQILQTGLLPLQDGAHPTQSGSLQLFAAIHRIPVLHQTHVVFGNTEEDERDETLVFSCTHTPVDFQLLFYGSFVYFILGSVQVSNLWSDLLIDQILGNVNLSQGQLVMVFVVKHVHKIGIEWMDILKKTTTHF